MSSEEVLDSAIPGSFEHPASSINCAMGVTVELQNLGDSQLCDEIVARIEHAFSEKPGEWRVSVAGSHGSENWEMHVEGPSGFVRSYTLAGAAGQHEPEAICRLVLQLVLAGSP